MSTLRASHLALSLLVATLAAACAGPGLDGDGVFRLRGSNPKYPLLRYSDGQPSVNDSCVIRLENPLNPKMPPSYGNGRPIGFC